LSSVRTHLGFRVDTRSPKGKPMGSLESGWETVCVREGQTSNGGMDLVSRSTKDATDFHHSVSGRRQPP